MFQNNAKSTKIYINLLSFISTNMKVICNLIYDSVATVHYKWPLKLYKWPPYFTTTD